MAVRDRVSLRVRGLRWEGIAADHKKHLQYKKPILEDSGEGIKVMGSRGSINSEKKK